MQNILFWAILTLFGTLVVLPLTNHLTKLERTSLGLLIGSGLHSILYFITLKFLDSVYPSYYLFPIELAVSSIVSRLPRINPSNSSFHIKNENMIITVLGAIVGAMILGYTFLQATFWPVYEPDAIHLYDYRAQRLLLNDKTVLFNSLPYEHNSQYPPFTSLFHLFSYQNGLTNPKVLYPILYITWYVCLVEYLLRTTKSPILSIWGANIIISSPNIWWQSFQAMTNVPYMIYLSLGGIYLSEVSNNSKAIIYISGILTAIAIFIRLEPLWLSGIIFLVFDSIITKTPKKLITWLSIIIIFTIPWRNLGPQNDTIIQQISGEIRQIIIPKQLHSPIDGILLSVNFLLKYYLQATIILLASITIRIKQKISITPLQIYALSIITTLLLGIVNIYLRYPHWYEYTDSIRRMMIVIVPAIWISFIQESSKVIDQL